MTTEEIRKKVVALNPAGLIRPRTITLKDGTEISGIVSGYSKKVSGNRNDETVQILDVTTDNTRTVRIEDIDRL